MPVYSCYLVYTATTCCRSKVALAERGGRGNNADGAGFGKRQNRTGFGGGGKVASMVVTSFSYDEALGAAVVEKTRANRAGALMRFCCKIDLPRQHHLQDARRKHRQMEIIVGSHM